MGNERSALNGIDIEDKSLEVTDFWTHYRAIVDGPNLKAVSIFISEPSLHYSASFGRPSPLERAAKNLMLHRHPCILKYISSVRKGSKFLLTAEEVKPLIQTVQQQNTLQICIGLHSILRALTFLHEKACASHNNICPSSVYVTPEGCWKLGGLEFLCKNAELTPAYFQTLKTYRYENAIAKGEDVKKLIEDGNLGAIDVYAFGILAEGILKSRNDDDVPGLSEFKLFCKENLQNSDASLRSKLSLILQHPFFTHDFMRIHAFLEELPLKVNSEREEFFSNLVERLRNYSENIVAEQLGRLLLSRMVLLDLTAQTKLLPFILRPQDDSEETENSHVYSPNSATTSKLAYENNTVDASNLSNLEYSRGTNDSATAHYLHNSETVSVPYIPASNTSKPSYANGISDSPNSNYSHASLSNKIHTSIKPLFSLATFKKYIAPRLKQIFCIRDASIRTLLLIHFESFVHSFQTDELKTCILPELLVGIKDTNDELVALTLKSLSFVVPILGAATVIGGKRGKLFTDGRPKGKNEKCERIESAEKSFVSELGNLTRTVAKVGSDPLTNSYTADVQIAHLPERPSPDGGEDKEKETEFEAYAQEEESGWSDWEGHEGDTQKSAGTQPTNTVQEIVQEEHIESVPTKQEVYSSPVTKQKELPRYSKKPVISDITELDIKHSKSINCAKEEIDFFTDMEPVIKKTQVLQIEEATASNKSIFDINNVSATSNEDPGDGNDGWEEDLSDWGAEDSQELKL